MTSMEVPGRIPAWVDGKLTPVDKMEVHRKGLRHKAVSVFVMCRDQVLIQQRALSKYHTPGLWANTCCTHPLWDETPENCAVRRLREELGIEGLAPEFRDRIEYRADVGGGMTEHEVVDIFLAHAMADLNVAPNPDEVADVKWVPVHELTENARQDPHRYTAWLRIYLDRHADQIFGGMVSA